MPVRLRITLLFLSLVVVILGICCAGIYYFSYNARVNTIKTRLTNRAITTARFLVQKEVFDLQLVRRIDSLTTIALQNKTVQAYDYLDNKMYSYSDLPGDTLKITREILDNARVGQSYYFTMGNKEVVAYHYTGHNSGIVVISAAEDVEGRENMRRLKNILLTIFVIGVVFILVTGYIFSTRLLKPIRKITADVKEISAQNLARKIETGNTKDEWFYFARTLNDLLDRLKESFDLQRRFISNASHELSTPLTSISSQLEVSLQRARPAEEYRRVMQSVHQDVQNMSQLIQVLLEFAKASGNVGGLEIDLLRVDETVMKIPSEVMKMNPGYSVKLQFGKLPENEEDLRVFGNEALLFSAIKNIVLNACKYSENKMALIFFEINNHTIEISVSDQGQGINEVDLHKIFQPFYRTEGNISSAGFGLGLSLADRIIKMHKGWITVVSKASIGSTFTVHLPIVTKLA